MWRRAVRLCMMVSGEEQLAEVKSGPPHDARVIALVQPSIFACIIRACPYPSHLTTCMRLQRCHVQYAKACLECLTSSCSQFVI